MAKQGQILALEKTAKGMAESTITRSHQVMQKDTLLNGISRIYQAKFEDGDQFPPERTRVQVRVHEEIAKVTAAVGRALDLAATKEKTNTYAKADLVIDGVTLVKDVPAGVLMLLERELINVETFVTKLPTLDMAEDWHFDANTDSYATEQTQTAKSVRVPRNHVLAEATPQHPAQVKVFEEAQVVGTWTQTKYSGALPVKEVTDLKDRVRKLRDAVKVAREEANTATATDLKIGDTLFGYVFGGTLPSS